MVPQAQVPYKALILMASRFSRENLSFSKQCFEKPIHCCIETCVALATCPMVDAIRGWAIASKGSSLLFLMAKCLLVFLFSLRIFRTGKTHTMVGSKMDPGLMVRSLESIFTAIQNDTAHDYAVTCSYLEVYNEVIYDLLDSQQQGLDLREDPEEGVKVAGINSISSSLFPIGPCNFIVLVKS